jgi:hypothetical protein
LWRSRRNERKSTFHSKMSAVFANIERFYRGEPLINRIELG